MTELQAAEIIETVIKSHWPNWTFSIIETKEWVRALVRFDYERAKAAISNFYMDQTKQGKPAPGSLIIALKANAIVRKMNQQKEESTGPLFGILRADGHPRWHKFVGNLNMAQQEIEVMALNFCRKANLIESGHYIEYYSAETEQEGYTGEQGCTLTMRRQQARDKAFADILNGPDSKTKQWLQVYLMKKFKKEDGPQLIGGVLKIL